MGHAGEEPCDWGKTAEEMCREPTVLLPLVEIRRVLDSVKEPTRSLLVLMVLASMRPGEVLALRWKDVLPDRIVVDERVYDNEFDEVNTKQEIERSPH